MRYLFLVTLVSFACRWTIAETSTQPDLMTDQLRSSLQGGGSIDSAVQSCIQKFGQDLAKLCREAVGNVLAGISGGTASQTQGTDNSSMMMVLSLIGSGQDSGSGDPSATTTASTGAGDPSAGNPSTAGGLPTIGDD